MSHLSTWDTTHHSEAWIGITDSWVANQCSLSSDNFPSKTHKAGQQIQPLQRLC
ncbi:hypothetical protein DPMN_103985 [Dreissena polymorpha]|uniref:Uncharacterized protein n=1 Tax=Dreissena polymorpha TaxID=45954 RepID=A0A9D4K192_DREPO|nr:hypothetical protein DPMN_103906 [Dreissena polymorpha]KAH3830734.1 hypothetical protein DPMN_103985 [Dreissena polymorpha]